jgi:hypothetical protein
MQEIRLKLSRPKKWRIFHDAINMISDESNLPLIISLHAIQCKYEIFSFVLPIPITRYDGCVIVDMSKM